MQALFGEKTRSLKAENKTNHAGAKTQTPKVQTTEGMVVMRAAIRTASAHTTNGSPGPNFLGDVDGPGENVRDAAIGRIWE